MPNAASFGSSNSRATVTVDKDYSVTISAAKTVTPSQTVKVTLTNTSNSVNTTYTLTGEQGKHGPLQTANDEKYIAFGPYNSTSTVDLDFDSTLSSDFTNASNQLHVKDFVDVYTFHVEDTSDSTNHDVTAVVTLNATETP